MKRRLTLNSLFASAVVLLLPAVTNAQQFELFSGEAGGRTDFRLYIQAFYRFSISAAILIATVLIMIGGIMWVTSAGNPSRIEKAKSYIVDSIIGVVLLMAAYTILQVINPQLVNLTLPTLQTSFEIGACIVSPDASTRGTGSNSFGTGKKCYNGTEGQCSVLYCNSIQNTSSECKAPGGVFNKGEKCADLCQSVNADGECTPKIQRSSPSTPSGPTATPKTDELERLRAQLAECGSQVNKEVETTTLRTDTGDCEAHCASFPACTYSSHTSLGFTSGLVQCTCKGSPQGIADLQRLQRESAAELQAIEAARQQQQ